MARLGFKFPLTLDGGGAVEHDSSVSRLKRLLASAILMGIGESIGNPQKGFLGRQELFRKDDETSRQFLRYIIRTQIEKYFPDIQLMLIDFDTLTQSDGSVIKIVKIGYIDLDTNTNSLIGIEINRN